MGKRRKRPFPRKQKRAGVGAAQNQRGEGRRGWRAENRNGGRVGCARAASRVQAGLDEGPGGAGARPRSAARGAASVLGFGQQRQVAAQSRFSLAGLGARGQRFRPPAPPRPGSAGREKSAAGTRVSPRDVPSCGAHAGFSWPETEMWAGSSAPNHADPDPPVKGSRFLQTSERGSGTATPEPPPCGATAAPPRKVNDGLPGCAVSSVGTGARAAGVVGEEPGGPEPSLVGAPTPE